MNPSQNGRLILEVLRPFRLEPTDGISIDSLMRVAIEYGASLDEIENSLIQSSANGWIMIAGETIYLTARGYGLLSPANDN